MVLISLVRFVVVQLLCIHVQRHAEVENAEIWVFHLSRAIELTDPDDI